MKDLLKKLNYKDQKRIAIINSDDVFFEQVRMELPEIIVDREIDQRCPYTFIIIFVKSVIQVEHHAPIALHNLTADGILWFCYQKKRLQKHTPGLDRDHGWKVLNDAGFHGIRIISIDEDWSAMRFRNIKFIKSKSGRFEK